MDNKTEALIKKIIAFRDKRDWKQFHNLKDLLIGLNIEVSELQELFLWKNNKEIKKIKKERIEEEIADIFIFLTYICEDLNIILDDAVRAKIKMNEEKYPISKSKGSNKKYNEL